MENYIVINGKKAELTKEQLEKLGIRVEKDIFNPKEGEVYCCINGYGCLEIGPYANKTLSESYKEVANCCTDESIMRQRAWHEILHRLLWRFSMQNGGDEMIWNTCKVKFYIFYDREEKEFDIGSMFVNKSMDIYFVSKDVAQEAIDTIVKPFMKQNPDFVW